VPMLSGLGLYRPALPLPFEPVYRTSLREFRRAFDCFGAAFF
jgi:hypothetical protein